MRFDGTLTALNRAGYELDKAEQSLEGEKLVFQGWDKTQCESFLREVIKIRKEIKELFRLVREKSC